MLNPDDIAYGETFEAYFLWGKKRHHPRYPLDAPVEFVIEDILPSASLVEQAKGYDISLGGIGVLPPETSRRVPQIGSTVRLQLMVEGINEPLIVDGVVVHADPQHGFGVQFQTPTGRVRKRLKQVVTMRAAA